MKLSTGVRLLNVTASDEDESSSRSIQTTPSSQNNGTQPFSVVAYRVPSEHYACKCDQCGASLGEDHAGVAFCDKLEAIIGSMPIQTEEAARLAGVDVFHCP